MPPLLESLALVGDSREDSIFVRALDCVTLAAHKGHRSLARIEITEINQDLVLTKNRVQVLQSEARKRTRDSQDMNALLGVNDPYGTKPFGYSEQRGLSIRINKNAARLKERADTALQSLEILEGIVLIARHLTDAAYYEQ